MRIAIAGATGFLGSAMTRRLAARGEDVVPLPRREPPHATLLDAAPRGHAEIMLPHEAPLHPAPRGHAEIMLPHEATPLHPAPRGQDAELPQPEPFAVLSCSVSRGHAAGRQTAVENQVEALIWAAGTRDVESPLERAAHVDDLVAAIDQLRPRRVIYLSTAEVYGEAAVPFRESSLLAGSSAYALAKLDGEAALRGVAASTPDVVATALRIGVAYGPGQRPTMLVPQLVRALRSGEPIALSAGAQTRDFIHVDDVVDAVLATLAAPTLPAAINIGTGIETRICDLCRELARLAARATSRPESDLLAQLRFGERSQRPNEPARYVLSTDLAARVLHWQPLIALSEGLSTLIETSLTATSTAGAAPMPVPR